MHTKNMDKETRAWAENVYERAERYQQRIPENGWLYIEELSGPNGAHYTLFPPGDPSNEDIQQAMRYCRNHWDCTGFTIIKGMVHQETIQIRKEFLKIDSHQLIGTLPSED